MTREIALRIPSCSGARSRGRTVVAGTTTEGWQDKRAHGARRLGGCFCSCFRRVPHRVACARTLRDVPKFLKMFPVSHSSGISHAR